MDLGFTFYPQNWWTSKHFITLAPLERYFYLEALFYMYINPEGLEDDREFFGQLLRTEISPETWARVTKSFTRVGDYLQSETIAKRRTRAESARINGAKGGRPEKPKNPENETQEKPKKPTLEKNDNDKFNGKETKPKVYVSEDTSKIEGSDRSRWPLWGAALREAPSLLPTKKNFVAYYKRLDEAIKSGSIPVDKPGETARAFLFFFPIKIAPQDQDKIAQAVDEFETPGRLSVLESLQSNLVAWAHDRREPPEIIKAMKSFYSGLIEIPEDL